MHVSISAEKISEVFGLPITNSLIHSLFVGALIIAIAVAVRISLKTVPDRGQSMFEIMIEYLYDLVGSISKSHVKQFFPLVMTLFLYILISNWLGLIPGLAGFGIEHVDHGEKIITPLFRAATADLNTTLALALVSVAATHYYGLKDLGVKLHLSKYINFKSAIDFFVGILELISEFAKIISFSFRLFGNIFAGEVLLAVMGMLIPVIVPLPFLALEVFVGFIQAAVFAVLTAGFLGLAVEKAH